MKLSKQELIDMIRQEADVIKKRLIEESEAVSSTKKVYDVDMNKNDELGHSEKALVFKNKTKKTEKEGEKSPEVKMNSNQNKLGSDTNSAVIVKVDAGAKKGGSDVTSGQAKANFTSKKDIQDTSASAPFDDRVGELEMNSEDKLVDEETKTYVSAGEAKGGKDHTAGQHKAQVHDKLPKKDAEEPTDRIADGIEIDGSNIKLKESYTKSELKSFILSEAKKVATNHVENKVKESKREELLKELSLIKESLEECGYETEELEEIFGFGKKKVELTPDQAIEAGKKKLESDVVLKGALRKQQPKDMRKFLMSLGFNPEIKYRKWDSNADAPDGTKGYYVDSTVYSGQGSGGNTSMSAE